MIYGSVSRRYAKALCDLGEEKGILAALVEGMQLFDRLLRENGAMRQALTSPVVPQAAKAQIVGRVAEKAGLHDFARRFLLLLARKGRMDSVPLITLTLGEMADRKAGILRGDVRSAFPPEPGEVEALTRTLEAKTGKKVILEQKIDTALIGGIVVRIGNRIVDGSIQGALAEIKRRLTGEMNP